MADVPVGIVVPVLNESRFLPRLLTSIAGQEGLESLCRISAVDGASEDDSREIIRSWSGRLPMLRLLENPKRVTPVAFNIGIRDCLDAGAEAILLLGGHSALEPGFLRVLAGHLRTDEADLIGSIHAYPETRSAFETGIRAYAESRLGRRLVRYSRLSAPTKTFVAYCPTVRRRVFEKVGLFDEKLIRNQDNEFQARARDAGFRFLSDPGMRYLYSPPDSFARHLRQMWGNGRWVGRRTYGYEVKHVAPALFWTAILVLGIAAAAGLAPAAWLLVGLLAVYFGAILGVSFAWKRRLGASLRWLPILFVGGHLAYAVGTFQGLFERLTGRE